MSENEIEMFSTTAIYLRTIADHICEEKTCGNT
jgi:hypothetical protein